jgi:hypothetical protein
MAIVSIKRPNEPIFMTAEQAATRRGYAGRAELALRNSLERFCRSRWPEARICHEMMMGERRVRADVVAVDTAHIAAFEVKGEYDETVRLLHQVGMYQLCVPEVWMVVPVGRHAEDARILRHLLPCVGLLVGAGQSAKDYYAFDGKDFDLVVEAEPSPRPVHPEMMLEMLWRDELFGACGRQRIALSKKPTRPEMIKNLLDLPIETLQREVCIELRGRNAMWRADAPIIPHSTTTLLSHDKP